MVLYKAINRKNFTDKLDKGLFVNPIFLIIIEPFLVIK